jgi:hypothetical protein
MADFRKLLQDFHEMSKPQGWRRIAVTPKN